MSETLVGAERLNKKNGWIKTKSNKMRRNEETKQNEKILSRKNRNEDIDIGWFLK